MLVLTGRNVFPGLMLSIAKVASCRVRQEGRRHEDGRSPRRCGWAPPGRFRLLNPQHAFRIGVRRRLRFHAEGATIAREDRRRRALPCGARLLTNGHPIRCRSWYHLVGASSSHERS